MNKLKIKEEKVINVEDNEVRELYFYQDDECSYVFRLGRNANLVVYHYIFDASTSVLIELDGEGSEVSYHSSVLSRDDNKFMLHVDHNASNTISNVYNHGVNRNSNKLDFDICGKVLNTSKNCICNQENQIININDGHSTILPKLLIDQYEVTSSHSAYIGKFSDDILFYLMSRGISKKIAYELLIRALLINQGSLDVIEVKKMIEKIEMI